MYNGIGLTTPRGSGTSGYVQRNLSALRVHDRNNDKSTWDIAPPKYREPDEGILEHERKRKVEVKCLELELELEDKEVDEAEIERRVDELRQKLLANLAVEAKSGRGSFKPSDTHAMAAAKKTELAKMARALGTRADYQEGDAFDKEKQEEAKQRRILEKEEREKERVERAKKKEEERKRMEEQKKKWQEERRRRFEEEKERRKEREREPRRGDRDGRPMPPPAGVPRRDYRDRDRESSRRSPPPLTRGERRERPAVRDMLPPIAPMRKRERDSHSRSRSRSPRTRRRVHSRSRSASRSDSTDSVGRENVRRRSPSRSPPRQKWTRERAALSPVRPGRRSDNDRARARDNVELPLRRSPSPRRDIRRGGRAPSRSVSRSPSRSLSPPARRGRYDSPSRSRSHSPQPGVQARLGRSEGRRYASPSRSRTPPPPSRDERGGQEPPYLPTPTGPIARRSRSASTGSSMSVSSRSASGSRSD